MSDVAQLETLLVETGQPDSPLRHNQVMEYVEEVRRLGGIIEQRDAEDRPGQAWIGGDIGQARRRIREITKILKDQAPKRITGERANAAYALATRIKDTVLTPGMLPRHVMRRNPAGSVGHFQRNEGSRTWKRAALTFKRAIRALDPENADPDLTNLERFRPEGGGPNGTASFMSDATIPGYHAMTPQAKQNWPLGEPTADTAQKQAARASQGNGHRTKKKTKAPREKRPASPAQLEAIQRMRAALAAKRAGEARPVETQP